MRNLVGDAMEEFKNIPNSMSGPNTCYASQPDRSISAPGASVPRFTLFRCFTDGCSDYAGTPLAERLRIVYGAPFTLGYAT